MESTTLVLSSLSIVNIVILGILVSTFVKIYNQTRAQLPLGMIVVAGMLLLHNVIGAMAYFSMDTLFSPSIFPYMLGVVVAELIGIIIFLKVTLYQ